MTLIKSINTVEIEPAWTTRYEIDWTLQDDHDFTSTSSVTIDGVTWSLSGAGYATDAEIAEGTGIELSPNTGVTSQLYPLASDALFARIMANVAGGSNPIYGSATTTQGLCFQAIMDYSVAMGGNWDEYGLTLLNELHSYYSVATRQYATSVGGSNRLAKLLRGVNVYSGSPASEYLYVNSTAETDQYTFFELVFYPGGTVVVSLSDASDFVDPLSATAFQRMFTTNKSLMLSSANSGGTSTGTDVDWDKDDMFVGFYIANNGDSTAFKSVIKKFRMLTLGS